MRPLITGDRGNNSVSANPRTPFCGRATSHKAIACKPPALRFASMPVGIRQESEVSCPLYCRRQLALIMCFGTRDTARDDLARFRNVSLQQVEILVVDLCNTFGGEAAIFSSA